MILLDFSQVMIGNLKSQIGNHTNVKINTSLFRHMVLNSIRLNKQKFRDCGELVIACDDKYSWRRVIFNHYKINRRREREKSELDLNYLFDLIDVIKDELREFFPYKIIQVEGAEADDIIGTIVRLFHEKEKIVILSGDKDFKQLQKYKNVVQYDPIQNKFIEELNPDKYLKEMIIRGDKGDSIPNFLSSSNTFADGLKQKNISNKNIIKWLEDDINNFCITNELKENWKRNDILINLENTPERIRTLIEEEYYNQSDKPKDRIFVYMIVKKMKTLIEHINEFL